MYVCMFVCMYIISSKKLYFKYKISVCVCVCVGFGTLKLFNGIFYVIRFITENFGAQILRVLPGYPAIYVPEYFILRKVDG